MPLFVLVLSLFSPAAHADRFDNQIQQLQRKNTQAAQGQQQLGHAATSLAGAIAAMQAEIATLDSQIKHTQNKAAELQQAISRSEAELAQQRQLLGVNVRAMYADQDISTLEMLASSKNLSHFLDQEQYRESLQAKIDATMQNIQKLMDQLAEEKKAVDTLLADQRGMQDRLHTQRTESDRLLRLNQSEQQALAQSLQANNAKTAELRRQQAAANVRGFVPKVQRGPAPRAVAKAASTAPSNGASYPWAGVPFPNSMPDPWGMYKRQCVSYTAWKVSNSGRHMPYWGGRGDAKKWDENARSAGIPVDTKPRAGDVAVSNSGTYGHVMYVEAVNGDGTITISQYNASWDGTYSEGRRSASGLTFIHF